MLFLETGYDRIRRAGIAMSSRQYVSMVTVLALPRKGMAPPPSLSLSLYLSVLLSRPVATGFDRMYVRMKSSRIGDEAP